MGRSDQPCPRPEADEPGQAHAPRGGGLGLRRGEIGGDLGLRVGGLGPPSCQWHRPRGKVADASGDKRRFVRSVRLVATVSPAVPQRMKRSITDGSRTFSGSSSRPTETEKPASLEVANNSALARTGLSGRAALTTARAKHPASSSTETGRNEATIAKAAALAGTSQVSGPVVVLTTVDIQ